MKHTITVDEYRHLTRRDKYNRDMSPEGRERRRRAGVILDSQAEAEFYDYIVNWGYIAHIDVHPMLTLHGGVRYQIDFLLWCHDQRAIAVEVKGPRALIDTTKWKLVDEYHPAGPLFVFRKRRWQWYRLVRKGSRVREEACDPRMVIQWYDTD